MKKTVEVVIFTISIDGGISEYTLGILDKSGTVKYLYIDQDTYDYKNKAKVVNYLFNRFTSVHGYPTSSKISYKLESIDTDDLNLPFQIVPKIEELEKTDTVAVPIGELLL